MGRTYLSRARSARRGATGAVLWSGLALVAACKTTTTPPPIADTQGDDASGTTDDRDATTVTTTNEASTSAQDDAGAAVDTGTVTCIANLTDDPKNCGYCGHSCQGGTCTAGLCPAAQIAQATNGSVQGIAVDDTHVFWTSPSGGIFDRALGGTAMTGVLPQTPNPYAIAVTATNLFWTDLSTQSVYEEVNPDNSSGSTFVWSLAPDGSVGAAKPVAIAVDVPQSPDAGGGAMSNVYWVDAELGTVNQAPQAGGNVIVLARNQAQPQAIAVDLDHVYWVNGGSGGIGTVNSVPIGGGTVTTLATGQSKPVGIAVDPSYTHIYWISGVNAHDQPSVSSVLSLAIGAPPGTPPTVLASGYGSPMGIAVDDEYVYWTNYTDGTVVKTRTSGEGAPYTLASGSTNCNNPAAIVVKDNTVYWANQGNGTIFKVPN